MKKKLVSSLLCAAMISSMLVGCGSSDNAPAATDAAAETETTETEATETEATDAADTTAESTDTASAEGGSVYYLNFKPEVDDAWQKIAADYTASTGVEVKVVTAASGTYEEVLKSEIAGSDAPTLFQINGPIGYNSWKDYCMDLSDTELFKDLSDQSLAVYGEDGKPYGVPYTVESYGIIYNDAIMQAYFAMDGAVATSIDDINNFDTLKAVVEDMQAKKDDLGIEGVFASTSLLPGEDWRWQTHLANIPVYYELKDKGVSDTDALEFTYSDNYKNIFDLYITDSTCAPTDLANKTATDAVTEFTSGEAVFYQNGTWEYTGIKDAGLTDDDLGMLPIYIGVDGEENQGLCTGSENYWCVNKNASEDDINATLDFVNWCVTSETGTAAMADNMGFVIPFKAAKEATNVFVKADAEYTAAGKTPVSWNFTTMPSEDWKNGVGTALTQYAAGTGSWDDVKTAFVQGWATEYAKANG